MAKLGIVKIRLEHDVNCYVVTAGTDALVVDPGEPVEKIVAQLRGVKVRWITATHGHIAHLAGKQALVDAVGGETAMHFADAKLFLRSAQRYVIDGDELEIADLKVRVLHTPGHTPGSICLVIGNHLFTGDTLLAGLPPRQTPQANLRQQLGSIGRLFQLAPNTALYPGHGPSSSLANEVATNPLFAAPV